MSVKVKCAVIVSTASGATAGLFVIRLRASTSHRRNT
jgi:hypothetical protein